MTSPVLAVAAGMVTVASPCVLPMLPLVLGASIGQRHPMRPPCIALGFALSFALMVLVFSAFAQVLGLSQQGLRQAAAVLLVVFGALMLWPAPFQWLAMRASGLTGRLAAVGERAGNGPWGGLLLGLSLGAVWTPCAGPVLAAILTLIATEPIGARTALLLACYAAGASIPMLAIAYGGQVATTRVRQLARHAHRLQQAFGLVILAVALAMLAGVDTDVTLWLTQHLPSIPTGL